MAITIIFVSYRNAMANRLKKKTPPPLDPEQLEPEKEVEVTVEEIVKDERTYKIAGAVCLLITLFLFIAFSSYLFTWQEDQDKVHQFGVKIFSVSDVKVSNLLGVLGAYIAHLFFYKGFGLASYLFCTFFFVLGVNLLFSKPVFSIVKNIKYVITGFLVLSVTLSFFGASSGFSWGGATGELINEWLVKWVGNFGTGALLVLAVVSYIIWRFNPTFTMPEFNWLKQKSSVADIDELFAEDNTTAAAPLETEEETLILQEGKSINELYAEQMGLIEKDPELPISQNKLKGDTKNVSVIMPATDLASPDLPPLAIVEKPDEATQDDINLADKPAPYLEEEIIPEPKVTRSKKVVAETEEEPELEINEGGEEDEDADETPVNQHNGLHVNYEPTLDLRDYKYPKLDLLETHGSEKIVHDPAELEANKNQILNTLKNYDIAIQRISATVGPTVTLYEIVPAAGVRISRIKNLEDDIALSLAALGIRIIAPIPGKGTIGIEVPNVRKTVVSMRTLLSSEKFQNNNFSLPIAIGKKIDNENFIVDLASMPHLLMAGATGQGKSVGLNAILVSLLYKKHPSQLKFVLVDPKKVELSLYRVIEKHFLAKLPGEEESIITDTKKVIYTLNALCIEMDNRYDLLKEAHCRNIKEYNEKFVSRKLNPQKGHQFLPFIVLVVDEFADLIMTAGKEVEMPIARLAQLARAVGIHLIIATQRPSVNIITGTIKANFPARIAFKVSSKIDSRTILDTGGAEQLIGKGDMLVSYNGEVTRLQCAFVDTPEVEHVCEFIGDQRGYPQAFLLPEYVDEKEMEGREFDASDRDPLFEDAARLIVQNQMGSTSLIQRRMKLGYNRAGRLMDQLEAAGVVGPNLGSKARDVLIKTEMELEELISGF